MNHQNNDNSIIKNKYYIIGFIHVVILLGLCIAISLFDIKSRNEQGGNDNINILSEPEVSDNNVDKEELAYANLIDADNFDNNDESISENNLLSTFDSSDWALILVNKTHQIPEDYEVPIGRIETSKGSMKCDRRVVQSIEKMMADAETDGIYLVITSPMRSETHQNYLFNKKIKQYMKNGMSYMDAYALAAQAVTIPGTSEHQIGLAFDITCKSYSLLNEGFGETDAGIWLRKHCAEYGFILRYPKEKEMITGIEYEPWHFRYVGVDAAKYMNEEGLCLEEFIDEIM